MWANVTLSSPSMQRKLFSTFPFAESDARRRCSCKQTNKQTEQTRGARPRELIFQIYFPCMEQVFAANPSSTHTHNGCETRREEEHERCEDDDCCRARRPLSSLRSLETALINSAPSARQLVATEKSLNRVRTFHSRWQWKTNWNFLRVSRVFVARGPVRRIQKWLPRINYYTTLDLALFSRSSKKQRMGLLFTSTRSHVRPSFRTRYDDRFSERLVWTDCRKLFIRNENI